MNAETRAACQATVLGVALGLAGCFWPEHVTRVHSPILVMVEPDAPRASPLGDVRKLSPLASMAFSADGSMLAVSHSGVTDWSLWSGSTYGYRISLWETRTGKRLACLDGASHDFLRVPMLAFSPDGKKLAAVCVPQVAEPPGQSFAAVTLLEVPSLRTQQTAAMEAWNVSVSVTFSPDGTKLVAAGIVWPDFQASLSQWDSEDLRNRTGRSFQERTPAAVLNPGGRRLALSRREIVQLWDVDAGEARTLQTDTPHWEGACYGRSKLAVHWVDFPVHGVTLLDAETGKARWSFTRSCRAGQWTRIRGLDLSPDEKTLACGSSSDSFMLWDVETGSHIATVSEVERGARIGIPPYTNLIRFSPAGGKLATLGIDGTIRIWDVSWISGLRGKNPCNRSGGQAATSRLTPSIRGRRSLRSSLFPAGRVSWLDGDGGTPRRCPRSLP